MSVIAEKTEPLAAGQPVTEAPVVPSHPALRVAAESLGVALVFVPAAILGLSYAVVGAVLGAFPLTSLTNFRIRS